MWSQIKTRTTFAILANRFSKQTVCLKRLTAQYNTATEKKVKLN